MLPVARVAVDVSLPHLDRPFEYLVPEALSEAATVGCRVRVRFAGRLTSGFLLSRTAEAEHEGRLGYLERVVSPEPVLTPEVAGLARAVADRYGGTLADVLRLAIPPRHAAVEAATRKPEPNTAPATGPVPPSRPAAGRRQPPAYRARRPAAPATTSRGAAAAAARPRRGEAAGSSPEHAAGATQPEEPAGAGQDSGRTPVPGPRARADRARAAAGHRGRAAGVLGALRGRAVVPGRAGRGRSPRAVWSALPGGTWAGRDRQRGGGRRQQRARGGHRACRMPAISS